MTAELVGVQFLFHTGRFQPVEYIRAILGERYPSPWAGWAQDSPVMRAEEKPKYQPARCNFRENKIQATSSYKCALEVHTHGPR